MKHLHLKLAIGIIVAFGLLLAGFALYEPVWFKYYEWRLQSDDAAIRETAAAAVGDKGERAMPYLQKWLNYSDDKHVIGACLSLEKMDGDTWKQALPELKEILRGNPSKATDAAAALIYKKVYKRYVSSFPHYLPWEDYLDNNNARRNICLFLIKNAEEYEIRKAAANSLINYADYYALTNIVALLHSNKLDNYFSRHLQFGLSQIIDNRALFDFIKMTKDNSKYVRRGAVYALGMMRNKHATRPVIKLLRSDPDNVVRSISADALGAINDQHATDSLIVTLKNGSDIFERISSAFALGRISDPRGINPLITILEDTKEPIELRISSALSLAMFDCSADTVNSACYRDIPKDNIFAKIVSAWRSGNFLEDICDIKSKYGCNSDFLLLIQIYWGKITALENNWPDTFISMKCVEVPGGYDYFVNNVICRFPKGFPKIDFTGNYSARKKQAKKIREWIKINKHRLAWNPDTRKYYLKPEAEE